MLFDDFLIFFALPSFVTALLYLFAGRLNGWEPQDLHPLDWFTVFALSLIWPVGLLVLLCEAWLWVRDK